MSCVMLCNNFTSHNEPTPTTPANSKRRRPAVNPAAALPPTCGKDPKNPPKNKTHFKNWKRGFSFWDLMCRECGLGDFFFFCFVFDAQRGRANETAEWRRDDRFPIVFFYLFWLVWGKGTVGGVWGRDVRVRRAPFVVVYGRENTTSYACCASLGKRQSNSIGLRRKQCVPLLHSKSGARMS